MVGDPVDEGEPREWRSLRDVAVLLSDRDSGLFTTALALANWHAKHTHCPRCGSATTAQQGGWVRRCTNDGSEHYPRTDPAVIMSVVDADDRLLLARGPQWGEARYSVLAGFVEPGESLEAAVAREVHEEVGVAVEDVALPRQPAVALPVLAHGRVHRDRQGHDVPPRRGRDRRGDLGLPRGAGERGRGRADRDLRRGSRSPAG